MIKCVSHFKHPAIQKTIGIAIKNQLDHENQHDKENEKRNRSQFK